MTDRLDAALVDLASQMEFPPTPDLRAPQKLVETPRRRWLVPLPRALALALIALLLLAAAATALVLGVPGLRLTLVPSQPTASVPADPLGARLALGAPFPSTRSPTSRRTRSGRPTRRTSSATGRSPRWSMPPARSCRSSTVATSAS